MGFKSIFDFTYDNQIIINVQLIHNFKNYTCRNQITFNRIIYYFIADKTETLDPGIEFPTLQFQISYYVSHKGMKNGISRVHTCMLSDM